ncbi:MAG TPA: acyl carrier protein [Actinocrinis sp.]
MERNAALFEKVAAVISVQFDIPPEQIAPHTRLADLDLDSIALIELAAVLEEDLGVTVSGPPITMEDQIGAIAERLVAAGVPE